MDLNEVFHYFMLKNVRVTDFVYEEVMRRKGHGIRTFAEEYGDFM